MNLGDFRCIHCQRKLAIASHGICSRCNALLARHSYCGSCGSLLLSDHNYCGNCLKDEPKWHHIVQIADYKPPLTEWIHRFKFQQQYWLDQPLARLLLLAIYQARRTHQLILPDVIFPVPLYWQREWQRGYNQAGLLAQYLAKWLNLPLDLHSLQRIRATSPQRELTEQERRRNLRNAFVYQPKQPYQRVALVDDVVTTGSTINAICAELLKQGVKEIQVWTLARA
ncbi:MULTISPECIES: phosphoribosyltransferase family protein [Glaesserella]|uniref:Amidophosphoribosyltransferase n=1 Tax=Glaesserella australis TaxID=2094024 RepID=A0A328BZ38_9PAST|nr:MULTISPECIES: phosphoribosyltransferase family protein [Glaesserella]AUI65078.1 amidophosphoribosyltransferase [Glaesserella sp. 15-184]RAL18100.1 amidophosphoribosyltransferase [Glaesserella australis]